ncbi:MAG: hypothetical protein ACAI44_18225 [Candidatus Sericytochromatia bacterium]
MDPNLTHLVVNHVPVLGSLLATGILAYGLLRKQEEIIRLSLYLFVLSAVAALPVYFSGEGAEEGVEHLSGVAESLIENHEDLAKFAIVLVEGLGLAAIGGLVLSFRATRLPLWYASIVGVLALFNGGVMAQTAHLGGQIRHSEIRTGAQGGRSENATEGARHAETEADEKTERFERNEISERNEPNERSERQEAEAR